MAFNSTKYFYTETGTDLLTAPQREKLMDFCTSPTRRNLPEEEGN